jgi:hypothetical protein
VAKTGGGCTNDAATGNVEAVAGIVAFWINRAFNSGPKESVRRPQSVPSGENEFLPNHLFCVVCENLHQRFDGLALGQSVS